MVTISLDAYIQSYFLNVAKKPPVTLDTNNQAKFVSFYFLYISYFRSYYFNTSNTKVYPVYTVNTLLYNNQEQDDIVHTTFKEHLFDILVIPPTSKQDG